MDGMNVKYDQLYYRALPVQVKFSVMESVAGFQEGLHQIIFNEISVNSLLVLMLPIKRKNT